MQPTVEYLGYRIDAQGMHAIEKKNCERMLYELHTGHAGIFRMKSHARLHVWTHKQSTPRWRDKRIVNWQSILKELFNVKGLTSSCSIINTGGFDF